MPRVVRKLMVAGASALDRGERVLRDLADEVLSESERALEDARAEQSARRAEAAADRERLDHLIATVVAEELARQNVASQASVAELQQRVSALEDALRVVSVPRPL